MRVQLDGLKLEHSDQRTNSAIRMMMGLGMPISQSRIERLASSPNAMSPRVMGSSIDARTRAGGEGGA